MIKENTTGDLVMTKKNATQEYVDNVTVGLKEFFLQLLAERKENMDIRLEERMLYTVTRLDNIEKSIEVANRENNLKVDSARVAADRRFDILNEFRQTVEDWTKRSATQDQLEGLRKEMILEIDKVCIKLDQINEEISSLKEFRANMTGRASQTSVIIFGGIAVVTFLMEVVRWFTK